MVPVSTGPILTIQPAATQERPPSVSGYSPLHMDTPTRNISAPPLNTPVSVTLHRPSPTPGPSTTPDLDPLALYNQVQLIQSQMTVVSARVNNMDDVSNKLDITIASMSPSHTTGQSQQQQLIHSTNNSTLKILIYFTP